MTRSDHSHSPLSLISDTGGGRRNLQFHLNIEPRANWSIDHFNESILALSRLKRSQRPPSIRHQVKNLGHCLDLCIILMINASYRDCAGCEGCYSVPDCGQRDPVLEIVDTLIRGQQREYDGQRIYPSWRGISVIVLFTVSITVCQRKHYSQQRHCPKCSSHLDSLTNVWFMVQVSGTIN